MIIIIPRSCNIFSNLITENSKLIPQFIMGRDLVITAYVRKPNSEYDSDNDHDSHDNNESLPNEFIELNVSARNNYYFKDGVIYTREQAGEFLDSLNRQADAIEEKQCLEKDMREKTNELCDIWQNIMSICTDIEKTQPESAKMLKAESIRIVTVETELKKLQTETDYDLENAISIMENVMAFFNKRSNRHYKYILIKND